MKILQYALGLMQANCYFLVNDDHCVIIDPADDASFILEELQRRRLKLEAMLATHGHFDHLMAAGEIQLSHNVPLFISNKDQFLIERLEETAEHFLEYKPTIIKPSKIQFLENEFPLATENWKLEIIFTPGHTPGSCCFYSNSEKVIFTGDTIFKQGIGRYDFSYSNKNDLDSSIKKILSLPIETVIYPGHGEKTNIIYSL